MTGESKSVLYQEDMRAVRRVAIASRLLIFCLQVVANNLVPDHHPDVFNPPVEKVSETVTSLDSDAIVQRLFGGLRRWDAVYFLFIAKNGYPYENTLAFFPLYPILVNQTASLAQNLPVAISFDSWLLFFGAFLNFIFFVKAAQALFEWTQLVSGGRFRSLGYAAAVAFCFNPASIFFSACYSEALFSYLTFKAFKLLEQRDTFRNRVSAVFLIALSGATRSNGLVSLGVFALKQLQKLRETMKLIPENKDNQSINRSAIPVDSHVNSPLARKPIHQNPANSLTQSSSRWPVWKIVLSTGALGVLGVVPFLLFQQHGYSLFCRPFTGASLPAFVTGYAKERGYVYLNSERPPSVWCNESLPFAYSHVQKSHWNVGFFQYYEAKQIPNFLLAFPILALSLWSLWKLFVHGDQKWNPTLLPYGVHLLFLLFFCVLFVHIQVSTRMICSSTPLIYLAVAHLFPSLRATFTWKTSLQQIFYRSKNRAQKLVAYYFLGYFVVGTVLHCNFLPWT